MELSDRAALSRRAGAEDEARQWFSKALEKEASAAHALEARHDMEPTRSVLFRSAASLALDCGEHRTAERLIASALIGEPPERIANELRDLMETVNFQRHLDLRGVKLQSDEFQLSMDGGGIGFGIAPADQFIGRVRDVETLIYRTAERRLNLPFRESGRRKKQLDESLQLFLSVPRAASFAVTFRIGASEQPDLPGMSLPSEIVRDVMDCFDLVNRGQLDELEDRIDSEAYFRNFMALAQKIAPDGDVVRTVGFTAAGDGNERRVALTVPRRELRPPQRPMLPPLPDEVLVELVGTLLEADAKDSTFGQIEIRTHTGLIERVSVPRGMMRDIVRPLFEEEVVLTGRRSAGRVHLESIRPADEA